MMMLWDMWDFRGEFAAGVTDQHSDTIESVEEITRRTQPALAHSPGKKCGLWSPVRTILRKPQSGQVSA